jgi:hypothetical protein
MRSNLNSRSQFDDAVVGKRRKSAMLPALRDMNANNDSLHRPLLQVLCAVVHGGLAAASKSPVALALSSLGGGSRNATVRFCSGT